MLKIILEECSIHVYQSSHYLIFVNIHVIAKQVIVKASLSEVIRHMKILNFVKLYFEITKLKSV